MTRPLQKHKKSAAKSHEVLPDKPKKAEKPQKNQKFPYIIAAFFISFMLVTAGAAIFPGLSYPGGTLACLDGTLSDTSNTTHPYSGATVKGSATLCTVGDKITNITFLSTIFSFIFYFIILSLVFKAVILLKEKFKS